MAGRETGTAGMGAVAAVPAVDLAQITAMAAAHHLAVLGGFACDGEAGVAAGTRTGGMACDLGAKALFPFGGPPYHPFYQWALRTGRVWDSPVRLLVQAEQGLMVSFRGVLALKQVIEVPAVAARPCDSCAKPCLAACPAGALGAAGYDVPACHGFLDSAAGADCINFGCGRSEE